MKADLLLANGAIYNGISKHPFTYLTIQGNRILAIGDGTGKSFIGRKTTTIDLRGKCVIPGFIDSHLHLLDYAWSLHRVNLEDCRGRQEVFAALRERAARAISGEWILGRGWRKAQFDGWPHRKLLDETFPENPVALNSKDGHFLWVNSKALQEAHLREAIPVPGAYFGIDPDGTLDGILGENAVDLVTKFIAKPRRESRKKSLLTAQQNLHRLGIVGLHSTDGNQAFGDLQELHAESRLRLRIFHSIPLHQLEDAVRINMRTGLGDSWFRFGFVKIFSDGALGSQSALMLQPYDQLGGTGIETISELELSEKIGLALRNGIAVGVHAIGDRANRQTLNAFERNANLIRIPAARSRIEHAQLVHPDDIARFRSLGILASMQPFHAVSDCELAERYWGKRATYSYAWRSLLDAGATLIFGTDAPVENPDPLTSLQAAVTRENWQDKSQTISAFEALQAYTYYPALASGEEKERGTLESGKLADLVILSEDPLKTDFGNLKVAGTLIDGEFVHGDFE